MEYYEDGLKIVEKYGILNIKLVFLNNVGGEVYLIYVTMIRLRNILKRLEQSP